MRIDNISYITQPSVIKNKNTNINLTQPSFGANIPTKALDNFNLFLKEYRKYKLSNSVYAVDYLFSLWKFMHKEGMRNLNQSELQLVEGLQNGLPTLEHLEMPQVQALVDLASKNSLTIPIVRGCKHTCAHCYLAATPPIKRISFEDFVNTVSDISQMSKRLHRSVNDEIDYANRTYLFYDSDCSQVFAYDKDGNVHEFPELARIAYKRLKKPAVFDTAGWDITDIETQKRMERFVEYCKKDRKEISQINISINPFEKLHYGAVMRMRRGDMKGYNYLRDKYIDMAVNTLHTFLPIFDHDNVNYISRAYMDDLSGLVLDGFRVRDMEKLRDDILRRFEEKYFMENFKPNTFESIYQSFNISHEVAASGRNNEFKNLDTWVWIDKNSFDSLLIDTDGQVYKDFQTSLTDTGIKLNLQNPISKEHKIDIKK